MCTLYDCHLAFSGFFGTRSGFLWWRQVGNPVMLTFLTAAACHIRCSVKHSLQQKQKSTAWKHESVHRRHIMQILICQSWPRYVLGTTRHMWISLSYSKSKVGLERKWQCVLLSLCPVSDVSLKPSHRLLLLYGRSKQTTERKECTSHQVPWHFTSTAPVIHNTTDMLVP